MLDDLLDKLTTALSPQEAARPRDQLLQARTLLRNGQFAQAAPLFEDLAQVARQNGRPGLAGEALLRATQCYVRAGNLDRADDLGVEAVRLLVQSQHYQRVAEVAPRVIQALERNGRSQQAQALRQELEAVRRTLPPRMRPRRRGLRPRLQQRPLVQRQLPASCPTCGAPARADEVDWTGPDSAACAYCGAGIPVTLKKVE
ncbi:MAG: hypothetical protein KKA73_29105 [Chloroflexi bacterium]|nr:hypothetical protein [Chloroflexota bacterium]MBU1751754.1 hypothetical protein [Chloroflexota bacterium]MBU1877578.1 hypothetical protein [Chloroflexota bacterium]